MKLLSYKYHTINYFGDSYEHIYHITIERTWFFGMFKSVYVQSQSVSMFANIKDYHEIWDRWVNTGIDIRSEL